MKNPRIPYAASLFLVILAVYYEILFHVWLEGSMALSFSLPLILFGLGFGCVLAIPAALLPKTWDKWYAVLVSLVLCVFFMAEVLLDDCFSALMTPKLMLTGAGGVANGFLGESVALMLGNWGKILAALLPIVLFAVLAGGNAFSWRGGLAFVLAAAALYGTGVLAMQNTGRLDSLTTQFDFDNSARCNGLAISALQELVGIGNASREFTFTEEAIPTLPAAVPDQQQTQAEEAEPVVEYGYNELLTLDLVTLAQGNNEYASLSRYVAGQVASHKNEYTGLFEGMNLILITAEAFTAEVINPELTPMLYRLANQGIRFSDAYQPSWNGGTTGGELANLSGLVPDNSGGMYNFTAQKPFTTIGRQLMNLGYFSRSYHNNTYEFYNRNTTHEDLGYEKFIALYSGMEEGVKAVWPESDLEMIDFTVSQYVDQEPFSIYYMTVSGHSLYTYEGNAMARKNYDRVKDMDCSEPVKCYLASQLELEYALESLMAQLDAAGVLERTVIALASDHFPYGLDSSSAWGNTQNYLCELFGIEGSYDYFSRDHSAMIIWASCLEGKDIVVDTPVSTLDLLPTLCNLFGLEYESRLLVGRDVFADNQSALVLWPNGSWITELGRYDGKTKTFTPNEGAEIPEGYVSYVVNIVRNKINYSRSAQENQYFRYLKRQMEKMADSDAENGNQSP